MSERLPDPPVGDDLPDPAASHGSDLDPRTDSDEEQPPRPSPPPGGGAADA